MVILGSPGTVGSLVRLDIVGSVGLLATRDILDRVVGQATAGIPEVE